jgi:protein-S-isoprenylcysteine O-methyltransferase Ste14
VSAVDRGEPIGTPPAQAGVAAERVWAVCFRLRNLLAGAPLAVALLSTRWEWEHDALVWSLALLLCGAGIALRTWAVCHNHYGQGRSKELATGGPYAYVRNPLYLGNLAILGGATVASELVWWVPVTLGWAFLVYAGAVNHEERRLAERYGERFLRYRAAVPAWLPAIRSSAHPLRAALLRQARAVLLLLPFLLKELKMLPFRLPF